MRAGALHGQNDQVAAIGDHARKDGFANETRSRRNDDFSQARTAIEKRFLALTRRLLVAKGEMHLGGEGGGAFGLAAHEEVIPLGQLLPSDGPGRLALLNGDKL
ncbi:hypothetical protein D3C87_1895520 [compost metagenome]